MLIMQQNHDLLESFLVHDSSYLDPMVDYVPKSLMKIVGPTWLPIQSIIIKQELIIGGPPFGNIVLGFGI